ncbi:MAG TPA: nitroreductase family deazaflavin-dependent oxidoreductase [Thermomicrobiales bacterium]|nr:nitroreductase family deazaflavin-dependent oxidoreductase [Thermomicrobiales bacterium]
MTAFPARVPEALHDEPIGYLETTGRVSGEPRETEIWFGVADAGRTIVLLSGYTNAKDWVKNLLRTPRVRFRIGETWFSGEAHEVYDEAGLAAARQLMADKYHGGDLDAGEGWARTGTPFAIALDLPRRPHADDARTGFIETVGRISGQPRETQIGFATDAEGNRIVAVASAGDRTDWVRNLRRNPAVRFRIGEAWYDGTASIATDEAEVEAIRSAMLAKYEGGKIGTDWIRTGMPIAIDLRIED